MALWIIWVRGAVCCMVILLLEMSACSCVLILMARLGKLGLVKIKLAHGRHFLAGKYKMAILFFEDSRTGREFKGDLSRAALGGEWQMRMLVGGWWCSRMSEEEVTASGVLEEVLAGAENTRRNYSRSHGDTKLPEGSYMARIGRARFDLFQCGT